MGGRIGGDDDDLIADINITPFVDIILVVLIIFMVTTSTIVKESIKVNLPEAASGEGTESTSLGLTLTEDGGLFLDGQPIDGPTLTQRIIQEKQKNPDVICLISADKLVSHGRVMWLIDLVKANGIGKFALNIDKKNLVGPDPASRQDKPDAQRQ